MKQPKFVVVHTRYMQMGTLQVTGLFDDKLTADDYASRCFNRKTMSVGIAVELTPPRKLSKLRGKNGRVRNRSKKGKSKD